MRTAPLAQSEVDELLQFLYLMPVAIARLGEAGAVEMLNPRAVQLLHDLDIDAGHADGPAILDRLSPGLSHLWRASSGRVGQVMPAVRCDPPRPQGIALHLMLRLVRPDLRCTMLAIEDVTTTVEQERELGRQRLRMAAVFENIHGYCAVMLDAAGAVLEWNPSIGHLLGIMEAGSIGRPLLSWVAADVQHQPPSPDFSGIKAEVLRQGWCRLQAPWRKIDGQVIWGDCIVTPVVESDGAIGGYVAVIRDVTDEHWRTQELLDAALTDPLTGLNNRRGLDQCAEALLHRRQGAPLLQTWIMVDIDHFKRINDIYGHDVGDAVLKSAASTLRRAARDGDILARYGGEEFVLLLPDTSAAAAAQVAERLRLTIEALAVESEGKIVRVTASFGVAQQAPDEDRAATLERADVALYRAKDEGRNRVILSPAE